MRTCCGSKLLGDCQCVFDEVFKGNLLIGVYLDRLSTEDERITKRVLLLKWEREFFMDMPNMFFRILICCLAIFSCSASTAEAGSGTSVSTTIVDPNHGDFVATFNLGSLPQPLERCMVQVTVEYRPSDPSVIGSTDYSLYLVGTDEGLEITGDSVLTFSAPIRSGDLVTGQFSFVTRKSGPNWIVLSPRPRRYVSGGIQGPRFAICMDETGALQYLDSPLIDETASCSQIITYFVSPMQTSMEMKQADQTVWNASLSPAPKISDTSEVQFHMTPRDDWPTGAMVDIRSNGLAVLDLPHPIGTAVRTGESVDLSFRIVPDTLPLMKSLTLLVVPDLGTRKQSLNYAVQAELFFWFDGNGKIQYADTRVISMPEVTADALSRGPCVPVVETYQIAPNGELLMKFGEAKQQNEVDRQ